MIFLQVPRLVTVSRKGTQPNRPGLKVYATNSESFFNCMSGCSSSTQSQAVRLEKPVDHTTSEKNKLKVKDDNSVMSSLFNYILFLVYYLKTGH